MKARSEDSAGPPADRAGRGPWLRIAAVALALLALSEALWLWQSWPVRELLPGPPPEARRS